MAADKKTAEKHGPQRSDDGRLTWALLFLAGLILLAIGYAVGRGGGTDLVAADTTTTNAEATAPAPGLGPGRIAGHTPGGAGGGRGQGQGQAAGRAVSGRSTVTHQALGRGPGLGPDGSGSPGQGNIDRVAGQGPYGVNFPGECPYGIYQPSDAASG